MPPPMVPIPRVRESPQRTTRLPRNIVGPFTSEWKKEESPIATSTRPKHTLPVPLQRQSAADEPIASRTRSHQAHIATTVTPSSAAKRRYPRNFLLDWAMPVLDEETGKTLEYSQLRKHPKYQAVWKQSYLNELGRLCQGIGSGTKGPWKQRTEGTDTFNIIDYADIPTDRRHEITYTKVFCLVREQKDDPNRTRITI